MSSELTIQFDSDMPPAAVEVVSPDLQTVANVMISSGGQAKVTAPSEWSFLRVHLPSGKVVNMTEERGQLNRFVSRARLDSAQGIVRPTERPKPVFAAAAEPVEPTAGAPELSVNDIRQYHVQRSMYREAAPPEDSQSGEAVQLGPDIFARIVAPFGPLAGKLNTEGNEATWELNFGNLGTPISSLEIMHPGGKFYALIPGNTQTVYARADQVQEGESLVVGVRIASKQPAADTILSYVERGDLYAAEAMIGWVEEAEAMLASKMSDPYAAAVGAYLLLKLKRFDRLHSWARNLADWFDILPDGCVIWAWQQIHENPKNEAEIRSYLLKAANRGHAEYPGLPVYSQGLRLLMDGLDLLPDDVEAQAAAEKLRKVSGAVIWDSPVTAGSKLDRASYSRHSPVVYDVSCMAAA